MPAAPQYSDTPREATLSLPAKAGPSPAAAPSPQRSIGRQLQETVAKMWDPVPYLGGRKVDFLAKMRERGIVMWCVGSAALCIYAYSLMAFSTTMQSALYGAR